MTSASKKMKKNSMKQIWFIAFSIWAGCQSPQPKSPKRPKNPTVEAPETTQTTPPTAQKSIAPAQYVQQLGKGMDVDWLKTGKGMENYSAQALKPSILLMDEPFAALDSDTKNNIYQYFLLLQRTEPCTVVLVTHDLNEAEILADELILLDKGQIVSQRKIVK